MTTHRLAEYAALDRPALLRRAVDLLVPWFRLPRRREYDREHDELHEAIQDAKEAFRRHGMGESEWRACRLEAAARVRAERAARAGTVEGS